MLNVDTMINETNCSDRNEIVLIEEAIKNMQLKETIENHKHIKAKIQT